ncbi:hypothetical protein FJT64_006011 [Amphibalanus amphitrite]|uniref:Uncharacterized protein n=1 Tax=Amphibalanus amphitrite TaxID=1232801 RepID=A0A6A4VY93_AMPAM|nr:hypothetical protein FJT64_006011 [Amphibalanus amphitrite]
MDVGRAAGISLAPETLDRSHRLGRLQPGKVRPIIVKFTSFNARQKMFLKRKELSAERVPNHPTLTRSAITKIYISECLTPKNQHLMYVARQLKKEKTLWAAYSTNGIVKIKKTEEEAAKPIKCLADLVDIAGADAARTAGSRRPLVADDGGHRRVGDGAPPRIKAQRERRAAQLSGRARPTTIQRTVDR